VAEWVLATEKATISELVPLKFDANSEVNMCLLQLIQWCLSLRLFHRS
jgi:hypothetical protein